MAQYELGEFSLDTRERVLRRSGQPLEVQRKVLACIELFVVHAGQLISDAQLRKRLWPDTHVLGRGPGAGAARRASSPARGPQP